MQTDVAAGITIIVNIDRKLWGKTRNKFKKHLPAGWKMRANGAYWRGEMDRFHRLRLTTRDCKAMSEMTPELLSTLQAIISLVAIP